MERTPLAPGSKEYLDSEKYESTHWDFNRREDNCSGLMTRLNAVRKANLALRRNASLAFDQTTILNLLRAARARFRVRTQS